MLSEEEAKIVYDFLDLVKKHATSDLPFNKWFKYSFNFRLNEDGLHDMCDPCLVLVSEKFINIVREST